MSGYGQPVVQPKTPSLFTDNSAKALVIGSLMTSPVHRISFLWLFNTLSKWWPNHDREILKIELLTTVKALQSEGEMKVDGNWDDLSSLMLEWLRGGPNNH